jgi:hypothetical protein
MARITLYPEHQVLELVNSDSVSGRRSKEWHMSVQALAGTWPKFPTAAQIRRWQAAAPRQTKIVKISRD